MKGFLGKLERNWYAGKGSYEDMTKVDHGVVIS